MTRRLRSAAIGIRPVHSYAVRAKTVSASFFCLSFRRNSLRKNPMGIQRIKPTPPFPCPHLAIPAQAGIQRK